MGKISEELTFGLTIRESANDGSDFTNPAADYRRLFLGEDGLLHVKDPAGTVTDPYAGAGLTVKDEGGALSTAATALDFVGAGVVASGTGATKTITVAGGSGLYSPDTVPGSPHASDDEFNGTLTGWTTLGSLNTSEANVVPSQYHVVKSATGDGFHGIYKASPSTPFTVSMHLRDWSQKDSYKGVGLMILDTTPSALFAFGTTSAYFPGVTWMKANVGGARGSYADAAAAGWPRPFFRLVVTSGTDVTCQYSIDGLIWETAFASQNSGITPTKVGIFVWPYSQPVEAFVDWIRFA